ncbi:membrane protein insertion efficiency factor YidD [Pseudonocardia eucalypti]|uniref:Putative membrane protein insertion efficiency factor n=1 Tax=Pseudonocardia eucalypti TaxID=648755 RepID=A0ABP9PEJ9_9PSEU|nr:putative membrane protein insertion efficiency factor [Pseudonocardia eucalypti]
MTGPGVLLAKPFIGLIRLYQRWISPGLPPTCRFYPSCSEYAVEALREHGLIGGLALTIWRLLRCAPWHPGGVDFVPPRRSRIAPEEQSAC